VAILTCSHWKGKILNRLERRFFASERGGRQGFGSGGGGGGGGEIVARLLEKSGEERGGMN